MFNFFLLLFYDYAILIAEFKYKDTPWKVWNIDNIIVGVHYLLM